MLDFPSNGLSTGQLFPDPRVDGLPQWSWDGRKWVGNPLPGPPIDVVTNAGRLFFDTATNAQFRPFNGNQIKIDGELHDFHNIGIDPAVEDGLWYVYAYIHSGDVALERQQVGHVTDTRPGNVGVEIMQGNPSRSLVGMFWSTAQEFVDTPQQRHIASWFNRQPMSLSSSVVGDTQVFQDAYALWNATRVSMLCWPDEALYVGGGQTTIQSTANVSGRVIICLDDDPADPIGGGLWNTFWFNGPRSLAVGQSFGGFQSVSEGKHTAVVAYRKDPGGTGLSMFSWEMQGTTWM